MDAHQKYPDLGVEITIKTAPCASGTVEEHAAALAKKRIELNEPMMRECVVCKKKHVRWGEVEVDVVPASEVARYMAMKFAEIALAQELVGEVRMDLVTPLV